MYTYSNFTRGHVYHMFPFKMLTMDTGNVLGALRASCTFVSTALSTTDEWCDNHGLWFDVDKLRPRYARRWYIVL